MLMRRTANWIASQLRHADDKKLRIQQLTIPAVLDVLGLPQRERNLCCSRGLKRKHEYFKEINEYLTQHIDINENTIYRN